jgi:hypothetical protein
MKSIRFNTAVRVGSADLPLQPCQQVLLLYHSRVTGRLQSGNDQIEEGASVADLH